MLIETERLENHGEGIGYLCLDYWDCECETEYINHISINQCPFCLAYQEDRPNSRLNEIVRAFKGTICVK